MRSRSIDVSKPLDHATMAIYYLFLVVLLLAPAVYNGFVLLNADSGFHLQESGAQDPWFDGPPHYSWFILPLHIIQTLWPIIAVQAAITVYVLTVLLKYTIDPQKGAWYVYSLFAAVLLTSLGLSSSLIAPDIFTPLMVISIYVLMHFIGEMTWFERGALLLVIVLACCFHQANFLIGLIVVFLSFCYQAVAAHRLPGRAGTILVIAAILAGLAGMILPNVVLHKQAVITRGSGVHLLARLVANGVALDYLRKACPAAGYAACAVVDDLQRLRDAKPKSDAGRQAIADAFLSEPVMAKMGGWTAVSADAAKINLEAIRAQPGRFAGIVGQDLLDQLGRFNSGAGLVVFDKTSPIYNLFAEAFPSAMFEAFRDSRQQTDKLNTAAFAVAHEIIIGLSLLLGVVLLVSVQHRPAVLSAAFTLLTAVIVNATVTSAFLTVSDQAQARIMPLVVIACVILVFAALQARDAREAGEPAAG